MKEIKEGRRRKKGGKKKKKQTKKEMKKKMRDRGYLLRCSPGI